MKPENFTSPMLNVILTVLLRGKEIAHVNVSDEGLEITLSDGTEFSTTIMRIKQDPEMWYQHLDVRQGNAIKFTGTYKKI